MTIINKLKDKFSSSKEPKKEEKEDGSKKLSKTGSRRGSRTAPPSNVATIDLAKEVGGFTIGPSRTPSNRPRDPTRLLSQNGASIDLSKELNGMKIGPGKTMKADGRTKTKVQQSAVTPTAHAPLGNMDRTFLEGLSPGKTTAGETKTQLASQSARQPSAKPQSIVPKTAISTIKSPQDVKMASRQTKYATMTPAQKEQQDGWAKSNINDFAPCPENFLWDRVTDGYVCKGKHHFISDELLAEGRGGMWMLDVGGDTSVRWGPYYAEEGNPKLFFYSGPAPLPDEAPRILGGNLNRETKKVMYLDYRARVFGE